MDFEQIYNDWINGNGGDKEAYRKMTKLDLVNYLIYVADQWNPQYRQDYAIKRIKACLLYGKR